MGIMSLAIREREEITIIANGSDEQAAITALGDFLSNKIGRKYGSPFEEPSKFFYPGSIF